MHLHVISEKTHLEINVVHLQDIKATRDASTK